MRSTKIYSPTTLELFKKHKWSIAQHLDEITEQDDFEELNRVRDLAIRDQERRRKCQDCDESMKTRGFVCDAHYHDYVVCGSDSCWTCYVARVLGEQLGIHEGY